MGTRFSGDFVLGQTVLTAQGACRTVFAAGTGGQSGLFLSDQTSDTQIQKYCDEDDYDDVCQVLF